MVHGCGLWMPNVKGVGSNQTPIDKRMGQKLAKSCGHLLWAMDGPY